VNPFSNPWLLWAVILTTGLQLLLLYRPVLAKFFGTVPLCPADLLVCVGLILLVDLELETITLRSVGMVASAVLSTGLMKVVLL
jgi:magnesium-transporting ATPase (P-type)